MPDYFSSYDLYKDVNLNNISNGQITTGSTDGAVNADNIDIFGSTDQSYANSSAIDSSIFKGSSLEEIKQKREDALNATDLTEETKNFWETVDKMGLDYLFETLDEDHNGTLSDEEIADFAELDGNSDNLSLTDLKDVFAKFLNDLFEFFGIKLDTDELNAETNDMINNTPLPTAPQQPYNSGRSAWAPVDPAQANAPTPEEKIQKLQTNKAGINQNAQNGVAEQENLIKEAIAQSDIPQEEQDAFNQENDLLDGEIANISAQIETQDGIINAKQAEISGKDVAISSLDSEISTIESTLNSIDTDSGDDEAKQANATIKSQMQTAAANLKAKKAELEKEKQQAQIDLDNAQKTKDDLTKQKEGLEQQKAGLMDNLLTNNPEAAEKIKDVVEECNRQIAEIKSSQEKAVEEIDNEIQGLRVEIAVNKEKSDVDNAIREEKKPFASKGVKAALELIEAELAKGVHENTGSNDGKEIDKYRNGSANGQAWCASFVSWAYGTGQDANAPFGYQASVSAIRAKAIEAGYYSQKGDYTPQPGDIMIQKNNGASHTGIVTKVDPDGTIHTIEGNTSDKVGARTYPPGSKGWNSISGWVRMEDWLSAGK